MDDATPQVQAGPGCKRCGWQGVLPRGSRDVVPCPECALAPPKDADGLPPLPEPVANVDVSNPIEGLKHARPGKSYYTHDQMVAYARTAIAASRQAAPEEVARLTGWMREHASVQDELGYTWAGAYLRRAADLLERLASPVRQKMPDDWTDDQKSAFRDGYTCGHFAASLAHKPAAPQQVEPIQARVAPWMQECFGPVISADRVERNHRFLEESLELVQAKGCTKDEAHQLVEYVYGRPVGEPAQEVGGVMVTLAALCLANDLDMHAEGEVELRRISTPAMIEKIRAKQAAKPKRSPLPLYTAVPAGLPDGYVLVPKEPTKKMEQAWMDAVADANERPIVAGYRAMLAAADTPPKPEQQR